MDRPKPFTVLIIIGVAMLVFSIGYGYIYARPVIPVVFPLSVNLTIGDHVEETNQQCYVLFVKTYWRVKPNGHPLFGDYRQYAVFKLRTIRDGDMLNYESYELEIQHNGVFNFVEHRFNVSLINDTMVNLVITPH